MSWIEVLLGKLSDCWPFERVRVWERAVRQTFLRPRRQWPFLDRAVAVEELGPGLHLRLWWIQELDSRCIVQDTINLKVQSITTKDDHTVSFSANVTYEITDVVKAVTVVTEFDNSLRDLAETHLARKIREWSWNELREGQAELERSLRGTMTTKAKEWGVRIVDVGITTLVQARQYRLFMSTE